MICFTSSVLSSAMGISIMTTQVSRKQKFHNVGDRCSKHLQAGFCCLGNTPMFENPRVTVKIARSSKIKCKFCARLLLKQGLNYLAQPQKISCNNGTLLLYGKFTEPLFSWSLSKYIAKQKYSTNCPLPACSSQSQFTWSVQIAVNRK